MSFRGKVVERKEIDSPFGKITIETKEYDPFPKRSKVIWWMGEDQVILLGKLITTYYSPSTENPFQKIKWKPLSYEVQLNEDADASDIFGMYFVEGDIEEEGHFPFDDLEEAKEFIEGVKCKTVKMGGINVDSKAEYERWVKAFKILRARRPDLFRGQWAHRGVEMKLMEYIETNAKLMESNPGVHLYQYLLDNGVHKVGSKPVTGHPILGKIPNISRVKGCYRNATIAALVCDEAKYIEGVAHGHILPMQHAWIEFEGEIYDPTWERLEILDKCEYLGVEVPKEHIEDTVDSDNPWMTPLLVMLQS